MHFLPKIFRLCALLLVAGAVVACDIETTPSTSQDLSDPETDGAFDREFVKDPYGIATSWFEYESSTHAILPRAYIYRLKTGDKTTLFQVKSYYTERGDSGYFSLERQVISAAGEAPQLIELAANIKDGPVCVHLEDAVEIDCSEARHDLVFRPEYRAVPDAGFAVANPAIYTTSHFIDSEKTELWRGGFDSLDAAAAAIDDASAWASYKDARTDPADALLYSTFHGLEVGDSSPAILQASADMKLIGWTFEKVDSAKLNFSANCVKLASEPNAQSLPLSSDAKSASLKFDADTISLVSLCAQGGPKIIEVSSTPYRALGPDVDTYDLVVDTLGDTPEIRLAPGHYILSSGADAIDAATTIPVELWD